MYDSLSSKKYKSKESFSAKGRHKILYGVLHLLGMFFQQLYSRHANTYRPNTMITSPHPLLYHYFVTKGSALSTSSVDTPIPEPPLQFRKSTAFVSNT